MSRRRALVPEASSGLNRFKMEVAHDLGVEYREEVQRSMGDMKSSAIGRMSSAGNVGGEMVKRMIAAVEQDMANKTSKQ